MHLMNLDIAKWKEGASFFLRERTYLHSLLCYCMRYSVVACTTLLLHATLCYYMHCFVIAYTALSLHKLLCCYIHHSVIVCTTLLLHAVLSSCVYDAGYGFSADLRLLRQAIPIWGDRHVVNMLDMCTVQAAVCQAKGIVATSESEKGILRPIFIHSYHVLVQNVIFTVLILDVLAWQIISLNWIL